MSDLKPPDVGNTSIRMGKSFLRPAKDRDHFELMRAVVTVRNDGERITTQAHGEPIGPLAIYRIKGRGDKTPDIGSMVQGGPPPEIRTSDPKTNEPMTLVLVWWPGEEDNA